MVTLVSQISDYFEQFNSSLTDDSNPRSYGLFGDRSLLSYYVFDFERYSDKIGTLNDLRTFMIQRWHNSFFYAMVYLMLIYGSFNNRNISSIAVFRRTNVYEEQTKIRFTFMFSNMEWSISDIFDLWSRSSFARTDLCHRSTWYQIFHL